MYLYSGDKALLHWDQNNISVFRNHLLPFQLRDKIVDTRKTGIAFHDIKVKEGIDQIEEYLKSRVLSIDRVNYEKLMNALHYEDTQSDQTRLQVALDMHAVSITDNYWVKCDNEDREWETVNIRKNSLSKVIQCIALRGENLTIQGKIHNPEYTTQGNYAKAWIRQNDGLYLCKANAEKHESEREILASNILDQTNVPHVSYQPYNFEGQFTCMCKNICSEERSIATAAQIKDWCKQMDLDFLDMVMKIDGNNFNKMLIVDYLISNVDRHYNNWGFYQDNETGNLIGLHPLFDHNNSLLLDDMVQDKPSKIMTDYSLKEVAKKAIKNCDFNFTQEITKQLFPQKELYEAFMEHCSELDLYHHKQFAFVSLPWKMDKNNNKYSGPTDNFLNIKKEAMENIKQKISTLINDEQDLDEYLHQNQLETMQNNINSKQNREKEREEEIEL